ncbi:serine threonine- kinase pim-1-like protein [Labeo rohita]|uniref:non-specific serine/threonine protein kinase n=1 Tax=Labeo rohita TaxID=84645 RepID=A0A498P3P0_LABRO|nr:serine threonine- kinase pim-1-like protein [Labeo rohita]
MFCRSSSGQGTSAEAGSGGPTVRRQSEFNPETALSEDEWKEASAFISHSSDEDAIKGKMKLTFDYHHNMVLDPMQSSDILTVFPQFKDIKGLIEQNFVLMFGEGVSGKLLKWITAFKKKVIQQCKKLPSTSDLEELLLAAESPTGDSEEGVNFGWDSDLSSIILLLYLIPPSAQGRKRPGKSGTNIEEHLREITAVAQPYLLAAGPWKSSVHQYFIVLDRHAIPCKSTSSLGAFDELFKAHFVFGTSYNIMLHNMYTFIQITVYNIDVGKVKESSRVAEIVNIVFSPVLTEDYIFSRYSVGDQLGKGGFGVVYEGRRLEDDLKVALKYVTKTEDMECIDIPDHPVPLPKEIALTFLANKGHRVPEIIRLLDWTDHPDHFVMVLECPSPCENLVEFMRRHGGSLDEYTVRQIMWQATNAAHMCCLRRVLHRDVKLENLLINRETSEVKLIDFGCGDILRMSPYRSYHGTAAYSPPEYYSRGEYCGWPATVWSLGILMFAMLCGHFPSDFDLHLLQYKRWSKPGLSKAGDASIPPLAFASCGASKPCVASCALA